MAETIEQLFVAQFERLQKENDELRAKVDEMSPKGLITRNQRGGGEIGVEDTGKSVRLVKVDVCSGWRVTGNHALKAKGLDYINEKLALPDPQFEAWAKSFHYDGSCYDECLITVSEKVFPFCVTVTEVDTTYTCALDPHGGVPLVDLDIVEDDMADNLGEWCQMGYQDDLLDVAIAQLRKEMGELVEQLSAEK